MGRLVSPARALLAGGPDARLVTGAEALGSDDAHHGEHAHADEQQHPVQVADQSHGGELLAAEVTDDDHVGDHHAHLGGVSGRQRRRDGHDGASLRVPVS